MLLLDPWGLGRRAPAWETLAALLPAPPLRWVNAVGFGQTRILSTKDSAWSLRVCSWTPLSTARFLGGHWLDGANRENAPS